TVKPDRADGHPRVGQRDGERPHTRTDLDDPFARLHVREAHDPARGVGIGEEILTQRPRLADPVACEQLANLARGHRSTPKARTAFTRVISAISSGATPRARASASPTSTTRAGSFGRPRCGSGVRNGESVSTSTRSSGVMRAASRRAPAFLNETM